MANPTSAQLAQIRTWVPAEWTPAEKFSTGAVFQAFALQGTVAATALSLCRLKLALLINEPSSMSVGSEYSQSNASAVSALRGVIITLEASVAAEVAAATAGVAINAYALTLVGRPKR